MGWGGGALVRFHLKHIMLPVTNFQWADEEGGSSEIPVGSRGEMTNACL